MSNIIILGGSGMLGRAVVAEATKRGISFVAPDRLKCNLSVESSYLTFLDNQEDIQYIINCAGLVPERKARPENIIRVNSIAPYQVACWALERGVRVFHISTDCVFSDRNLARNIHSIPDPIDLYGKSKSLGEVNLPTVTNIRTSFIGLGKYGLLNWLISNAGHDVPGYTSMYWSGTTTYELANALFNYIENGIFHPIEHFTTELSVTKDSLLRMLNSKLDLRCHIVAQNFPLGHRTLFPTVIMPPVEDLLDELADAYFMSIQP